MKTIIFISALIIAGTLNPEYLEAETMPSTLLLYIIILLWCIITDFHGWVEKFDIGT